MSSRLSALLIWAAVAASLAYWGLRWLAPPMAVPDNAVSVAAARTKGIVSDVAGRADILVVPDLESGNMLAKQLEYLGDAATAGIVLGARVPIVLTSRADSRETRLASCAVAVLLAHHYKGAPL